MPPIAKPPQDRTRIKYFVFAYFKLFSKLYARNATRDTLEDCYKWIEENPTIPIEVTFDTVKDAKMVSYFITKNVTDIKVIESKKLKIK